MAIYYEDKVLQQKKDGTELEQLYYKERKEIDKIFESNGGQIVLTREVKKVWDKDHNSYKPTPPFALPVEIPVYLESLGAISIRYSKSAPQRNGKIVTYPNNRLFIEDIKVLRETDKDLAWYLLMATKFVILNPDDKAEVQDKIHGILKIYNPGKEQKVKAGNLKRIAQVDNYLLNEDSLIYNKESLQRIGDLFGIKTNDDIELSALTIRESVLSGEEGKNPDVNIDRFLEIATEMADVAGLGTFTRIELDKMSQKELTLISKKLGTRRPPQCTRLVQTDEILAKQEVAVT